MPAAPPPPPRNAPPPKPPDATLRTVTERSNVEVRGLDSKFWRDIYPFLLSTSWPRLIVLIVTVYLVANACFGLLFWLDPGGVENVAAGSFPEAFYFSVQ